MHSGLKVNLTNI